MNLFWYSVSITFTKSCSKMNICCFSAPYSQYQDVNLGFWKFDLHSKNIFLTFYNPNNYLIYQKKKKQLTNELIMKIKPSSEQWLKAHRNISSVVGVKYVSSQLRTTNQMRNIEIIAQNILHTVLFHKQLCFRAQSFPLRDPHLPSC